MVLGIGSILATATSIAFDRGSPDDDTVDRLNHMVMYGLLVFLAVASGTRHYVGTAIYCWSPAELSEKIQRRYVNNYCWVSSMYSIPFEEPIPVAVEDRYFNDVNFYKLATVHFLALAVLFRLPHIVWKQLKRVTDASIEELIELTSQTALMDQDKRDEQLSKVAEFLHRWVSNRDTSDKKTSTSRWRRLLSSIITRGENSGHSVVFFYLFIKFLYLLNVIGQFYIISAFIKTNYWMFGVKAVMSYMKHGQWEDTYNFPRIAHCDYSIRQLQNVNTYTVQCVLAINLFLEKMFLLLWFCLIGMLFANALSLLKWMVQLLNEGRTINFLWKYFVHLVAGRSAAPEDAKKYLVMLRRYLKADGMFVIRMVAANTTDMLTVDLIKQIWFRYRRSHSFDPRSPAKNGININGNVVSAVKFSIRRMTTGNV